MRGSCEVISIFINMCTTGCTLAPCCPASGTCVTTGRKHGRLTKRDLNISLLEQDVKQDSACLITAHIVLVKVVCCFHVDVMAPNDLVIKTLSVKIEKIKKLTEISKISFLSKQTGK